MVLVECSTPSTVIKLLKVCGTKLAQQKADEHIGSGFIFMCIHIYHCEYLSVLKITVDFSDHDFLFTVHTLHQSEHSVVRFCNNKKNISTFSSEYILIWVPTGMGICNIFYWEEQLALWAHCNIDKLKLNLLPESFMLICCLTKQSLKGKGVSYDTSTKTEREVLP